MSDEEPATTSPRIRVWTWEELIPSGREVAALFAAMLFLRGLGLPWPEVGRLKAAADRWDAQRRPESALLPGSLACVFAEVAADSSSALYRDAAEIPKEALFDPADPTDM